MAIRSPILLKSTRQRFDALVRPHVPALYRFAFRLSGNQHDAEDLVQEVLTKLYPRTRELAGLHELKPWLHRVLYNQFVDATRRSARRLEDSDGGAEADRTEDPTTDPEEGARSAETARKIARALGKLDDDQRALVSLHLMDGHTLEELTRVFDVPLGTLKSRLHRTKAKLKVLLQMEPFAASDRGISEDRTLRAINGTRNA